MSIFSRGPKARDHVDPLVEAGFRIADALGMEPQIHSLSDDRAILIFLAEAVAELAEAQSARLKLVYEVADSIEGDFKP